MKWSYEISKAQVSRDLGIPYETVKKWEEPPVYVLRYYEVVERCNECEEKFLDIAEKLEAVKEILE